MLGWHGISRNIPKTNLIIYSELHIDCRTEKIGIIKGTITFLDNSCLFFTEYLDDKYKIEKLTYSFHYQQKDGTLIFRYDNAYHKPRLGFFSGIKIKQAVRE